jgi:uncharacterized protein (TIGR04255 family)
MFEATPTYKLPPIVERVVSVKARMKPEVYDERFSAWQEKVEAEFPINEPVKNWRVTIQRVHDVPSEFKPELEIIPRFSEKRSTEGYGWSIRCPLGQLTMNMHSSHKENRGYKDLRSRFPKWLKDWVTHFEVNDFDELTVHYVNILDQERLPSFSHDGEIEIQKVLRVFFNISGENEAFTPPMDCRVTINLKGNPNGRLHIHATDKSSGPNAAMTLNLVAVTELTKGQSVDEIVSLMDWCHDKIVERFEMIFTDEAKQSFKPYV